MAEEHQDKFSLPLAGVVALVAMAGAVVFYQTPLKTSRPIDQEAEKKAASPTRVQSRLWQDPFEAVATHRSKERERHKNEKSDQQKSKSQLPLIEDRSFQNLIKKIKDVKGVEGFSGFRIVPVLVDGSAYADGIESRLKDRYAVVSALGAADYMPESGEYIRYFAWSDTKTESKTEHEIIIPVERFIPKAKIRESKPEDVLVLWLKDQDFSEKEPLELIKKLIGDLKAELNPNPKKPKYEDKESKTYYTILGPRYLSQMAGETEQCWSKTYYTILGPRYSGTLSAMVKELLPDHKVACGGGNSMREDFRIYSNASTADENFIFDRLPDDKHQPEIDIQALFEGKDIGFIRTIGTEAVLAEQLVKELERRGVDLTSGIANKDLREAGKECGSPIALISEWDTLYGRALPRTFAAVMENMARNNGNINKDRLNSDIDKLRKDDWPEQIVRYSYLAGLDGELPPKKDGTEVDKTKDKTKDTDNKNKNRAVLRAMEEEAEGRDQLDYLQRLVMELKQKEESFNDESKDCNGLGKSPISELVGKRKRFKAIGVLGSDVYDKLLILQVLKKEFPQAIFFTTNLDARLLHPEHREWTRNLIVASHFGLQLHPDLQNPIPPFRDSSQTALFYSVFRALEHLNLIDEAFEKPRHLELANCSIDIKQWIAKNYNPTSIANPTGMSKRQRCFSTEIKPRLYEIGRSRAIDISPDIQLPEEFESIHAARPDLDEEKVRLPVKVETIIWAGFALFFLGIGAVLISHEVYDLFLGEKNKIFWIVGAMIIAVSAGVAMYAMTGGAAGEPFVLTQGVSVWPAVAIKLLAIYLCIGFFFYSRYQLNKHDKILSKKFGLPGREEGGPPKDEARKSFWELCFSIPYWHKTKNRNKEKSNMAESETNIVVLWREYRERRGWRYSSRRIGSQFLFLGLLILLLYQKIGFPPAPCRGDACFQIHGFTAFFSGLFIILLMLYVIDTTRLGRRFIVILCEKKFPWPSESLRIYNEARHLAVDRAYLNELACITLIGKWTAVISKLLYFPFIILFLLAVARYNYFDNFDWPIWLMVIYGFTVAYAVGVMIALRRTAEKARKRAVEQLEDKLHPNLSHPGDSLNREKRERQINQVIQAIKNNHEGAFMPFAKYPVLGALAVPAGGTGILYLIDYLVQSF